MSLLALLCQSLYIQPDQPTRLPLEDYEEELLIAMYNEGLIRMDYKPIQVVRSRTHWQELADKYGIRKSFDSVIRHLANKGYIDPHGKSGDVASLSAIGVAYVWQKLKERK